LPKIVTQRSLEQDLNPRPTDRKPKCLTRCTNMTLAITCCSSVLGFDNIQVLLFCELGLKTPIHAPKIGVLPKRGLSWFPCLTQCRLGRGLPPYQASLYQRYKIHRQTDRQTDTERSDSIGRTVLRTVAQNGSRGYYLIVLISDSIVRRFPGRCVEQRPTNYILHCIVLTLVSR